MKKILVVRFRQIGDAILTSVICNTLKKSFPEARIDYLVYDFVAPLFLNHPYIDRVISLDKSTRDNPFRYLKKVWEITREDYDIVIDVMSTPKSEIFSWFSPKAKFRIGRVGKKKKLLRGRSYTHGITEPENVKDKCDKFQKLLKPLEDAGYNLSYDNNIIIGITSEEKETLKKRMEEAGIDFRKKVFACAINSRRPEKIYPVENMKKLIKQMLEKYSDLQIIFFYSPDEKEFALKIHSELDNHERIFSNIETKSIRELGMLLSNCDFFFGNEGGPRHLAQGVGIPSFAIFSPGSSKKDWLPWNNPTNLGIEPRDVGGDSYEDITPEMVMENIQTMIEKFVKKDEEIL
ncbi:MAG: glycosyltransferase family 9 protein [Cetobacterium sp.]